MCRIRPSALLFSVVVMVTDLSKISRLVDCTIRGTPRIKEHVFKITLTKWYP